MSVTAFQLTVLWYCYSGAICYSSYPDSLLENIVGFMALSFSIGDSLSGTKENVCSLNLTSVYQTFSMMIEDWKSYINDTSPTSIVDDGWEREQN